MKFKRKIVSRKSIINQIILVALIVMTVIWCFKIVYSFINDNYVWFDLVYFILICLAAVRKW